MIGSGLEMGLGQAEEVQHQTFTETVMGKDLTFHWTAKLATSDPGGGHLCSLGNSLPANEANNKRRIKLETGVRGLERERERERETKNGVWLLATLKLTKRQGWWKEKFALFQRPVTWCVCVCVCVCVCMCVCVYFRGQ